MTADAIDQFEQTPKSRKSALKEKENDANSTYRGSKSNSNLMKAVGG